MAQTSASPSVAEAAPFGPTGRSSAVPCPVCHPGRLPGPCRHPFTTWKQTASFLAQLEGGLQHKGRRPRTRVFKIPGHSTTRGQSCVNSVLPVKKFRFARQLQFSVFQNSPTCLVSSFRSSKASCGPTLRLDPVSPRSPRLPRPDGLEWERMRGGGLRATLQEPDPGPRHRRQAARGGDAPQALELDRLAREASPPGLLSDSHDHREPGGPPVVWGRQRASLMGACRLGGGP